MTITAYDREIANGINLALYGETFEMMQQRLKQEAQKAAQRAAIQMKIQTIRNLYFQAKMNKKDIASVMNVEVSFVEKVIAEN